MDSSTLSSGGGETKEQWSSLKHATLILIVNLEEGKRILQEYKKPLCDCYMENK